MEAHLFWERGKKKERKKEKKFLLNTMIIAKPSFQNDVRSHPVYSPCIFTLYIQ
jgi:hypothetical protein